MSCGSQFSHCRIFFLTELPDIFSSGLYSTFVFQKPDPDAMPTILTPNLPDPENAQEVVCSAFSTVDFLLYVMCVNCSEIAGMPPEAAGISGRWKGLRASDADRYDSHGMVRRVSLVVPGPADISGHRRGSDADCNSHGSCEEHPWSSACRCEALEFTDEYLGIGAWLNLELAMCILCIYAGYLGVSVALGPSVTRLAFGGPSDVQTIIACAGSSTPRVLDVFGGVESASCTDAFLLRTGFLMLKSTACGKCDFCIIIRERRDVCTLRFHWLDDTCG
uniref:OSJNBa0038O10.12 protein n=1 Tax=Oryza sativa subsp. japonica TaxID=39947 RepID=Q7XKJ5_ORYSJ|nr:OSJNBa0038O10.12 [Oryza sativa Japonica Group]